MVARRLVGLILLALLSGCECSEVEIGDGTGGGAGAKPSQARTCEEICAEFDRRWNCDPEVCLTGCTAEFQAKLAAIGCSQIYLDFMTCVLEENDECGGGCSKEVTWRWNECGEALYATGSVTTGAGGN
jgi:hypothetical protein